MNEKRFIRRDEKVNFMEVSDGEFKRMKFFSAMSEEKNPQQYERKYVDESRERADVVGISSGVSFSMDERTNDEVHQKIVSIFEEEKLGDDSSVTILSVNFTKKITDHEGPGVAYEAKKREFSLIPESEGGDDEVYSYEGSLRVKGGIVNGAAIFDVELSSTNEQEDCEFEVLP